MINIRYPSKIGDQAMCVELEKGRGMIDQEIRSGNMVAINRKSERIILQNSKEILNEDEVLVFPRITGGV